MKIPPGLIITYNPLPDFYARLDSFYTQLDQIVLVDNGSNPGACRLLRQETERRGSSLSVIFNETNLGVATALNQGFRWALARGYSHIITFDQDSQPAPGMLPAMLEVFSAHAGDSRLAVVAPIIMDPLVKIRARYLRPKHKFLFERAFCDGGVLENVTFVITSGSLYDLLAYQQIGPFRDDFFIDYVDMEYCLRARQCGYQILVACGAYLNHRQGERQERVFGGFEHYPTFHSPLRWYYISRNRIPMLRRFALHFPHWLLYELAASLYIIMKMLLFETQKKAKLRAFFLGTLDGVQGRMGKAAEAVLKTVGYK
jgi:rhamnosyltransferase